MKCAACRTAIQQTANATKLTLDIAPTVAQWIILPTRTVTVQPSIDDTHERVQYVVVGFDASVRSTVLNAIDQPTRLPSHQPDVVLFLPGYRALTSDRFEGLHAVVQ
jgi:hypothetical protein